MELYGNLAEWWRLLSPPEDYEEEAEFFIGLFREYSANAPLNLLELGSGGGNTASHLKNYLELTLTDLSPGMLEMSRDLNPECEHVQGDMRSVQLNRTFDCVFVHDAVMYMCTKDDLHAVINTAYAHCEPGGVAIFSPDCVRETFSPDTGHGGSDGEDRCLRYLEWSWDPDPSDSTFITDYTVITREGHGDAKVMHERHEMGLFSSADWQGLLKEAGFDVIVIPDKWGRQNFIGRKAA